MLGSTLASSTISLSSKLLSCSIDGSKLSKSPSVAATSSIFWGSFWMALLFKPSSFTGHPNGSRSISLAVVSNSNASVGAGINNSNLSPFTSVKISPSRDLTLS